MGWRVKLFLLLVVGSFSASFASESPGLGPSVEESQISSDNERPQIDPEIGQDSSDLHQQENYLPPILPLPFFYSSLPPFRLRNMFLSNHLAPGGHLGSGRSLFPVRPGRAESNFIRFGRTPFGASDFKKNNFIRLGREPSRQSNFIRLGRSYWGSLGSMREGEKMERVGTFPTPTFENMNGVGRSGFATGSPWGDMRKDYPDV